MAGVAEEPSRSPELPRDGLLSGGPELGGGLHGDDLRPLLHQRADDGRDPQAGQELPAESGKPQTSTLPRPHILPEETPAEYGRRLEQAQGAVRRALSEPTDDREAVRRRLMEPLRLGGKAIDVLSAELRHPLLEAVNKAQEDIENGHHGEDDHGSWDGRWSRPTERQVNTVHKLHLQWPAGSNSDTREALTTAAQGRELRWSEMNEETRQEFRLAADDQWKKWLENEAVMVLGLDESRAVEQELERKGELERIMNPRFILVDKNAKLRSPECPLPLKANARIIVPGFRDLANLNGELRTDSPTASRIAQHVVCCVCAGHPEWCLLSAGVRAAFLKGDPYVQRQLYIRGTNPKLAPSIGIPTGCVAKVLTGIFWSC